MAAVWISGRASDFDGDGCEDPVTARFGPGLTVFEASHRKDTEGNRFFSSFNAALQTALTSTLKDGVEDQDRDNDGIEDKVDRPGNKRLIIDPWIELFSWLLNCLMLSSSLFCQYSVCFWLLASWYQISNISNLTALQHFALRCPFSPKQYNFVPGNPAEKNRRGRGISSGSTSRSV